MPFGGEGEQTVREKKEEREICCNQVVNAHIPHIHADAEGAERHEIQEKYQGHEGPNAREKPAIVDAVHSLRAWVKMRTCIS